MRARRFASVPACQTQAFYGPFRRPTTGRIRNTLTALALGLAGAWWLVHALSA
jgi:hypothetical protein